MKTYTVEQVRETLAQKALQDDLYRDNDGQVMIYGEIFEWDDGTFHSEPDPDRNKPRTGTEDQSGWNSGG
jgi:hypothetical protein